MMSSLKLHIGAMNPPTVSLWHELVGFKSSKNPTPPPDSRRKSGKVGKHMHIHLLGYYIIGYKKVSQ